ncbi:hypothetical protein SAMN05216551_10279 [Chitinasiproducens palmae]|uniref:Uncharacterized protein n=2 Tax=Chitinasiproducens palmae TaxID=1770053 RepID=A0A1H2PKB5_9BURK|nr:hypothetical protein SAMN05216551_10279 [Chitinasiproducens palmae]
MCAAARICRRLSLEHFRGWEYNAHDAHDTHETAPCVAIATGTAYLIWRNPCATMIGSEVSSTAVLRERALRQLGGVDVSLIH